MLPYELHHLSRVSGDIYADLGQGGRFAVGSALAVAPDNGAGVPHLLFLGRIQPGDVSHYWLGNPAVDELGRLLFLNAAYLADDYYQVGAFIFLEESQDFRHIGEDHRVSPDADDRALPVASLCQVNADLVRERAAAGDDADSPRVEHIGRHNAHFSFPWGDDTGAGRPDNLHFSSGRVFP